MKIEYFVQGNTRLLELDKDLQKKVKEDPRFFPWLESLVKTVPLNTPNAEEWYSKAPDNLISLVEQVSVIPRSRLLKPAMTEKPELSSGVPLFMSYYDFPYNSWVRNNQLATFLTESLTWLLMPYPVPPKDKLEQYRSQMSNPKKYGSIKRTGSPIFDQLPWMMRYMLLEMWIYHPDIRHPKMILSPTDWDFKPE